MKFDRKPMNEMDKYHLEEKAKEAEEEKRNAPQSIPTDVKSPSSEDDKQDLNHDQAQVYLQEIRRRLNEEK
jgi:hypothetical protein